jgi:hypothetical protein
MKAAERILKYTQPPEVDPEGKETGVIILAAIKGDEEDESSY